MWAGPVGADCPDGIAITPAAKPGNRCPLGQGFWKTHPGAWPVTTLTLGSQSYTQAELLALSDTPPGVRDVRETNFCRIHAWQDGRRAIVFAAIDNLWKGTASQAVQNLNLMFGRPEGEGIT